MEKEGLYCYKFSKEKKAKSRCFGNRQAQANK